MCRAPQVVLPVRSRRPALPVGASLLGAPGDDRALLVAAASAPEGAPFLEV
jgi:Asp-tRNA(Asn)/Glu-tRNA(Gln) amidotransferase A subunit family amidase